jgi:ABC-type sugar transport system permease subunit
VKITLPLLKKVLLFVLVANTTANLLLFAPMQLVTQGGPQGSTNVLMFEAYKSAFKYANQPRASALITVLLVLIVTICIVQFKFLNEKEERVA